MAVVELHMVDGFIYTGSDVDVMFDGKEKSVFVHKPNGAYTNVNWDYVLRYDVYQDLSDDPDE